MNEDPDDSSASSTPSPVDHSYISITALRNLVQEIDDVDGFYGGKGDNAKPETARSVRGGTSKADDGLMGLLVKKADGAFGLGIHRPLKQ